MGTRTFSRGEYRHWTEFALFVGICLALVIGAYMLGVALQVERVDTSLEVADVARYHTLAGVAGVRALDNAISAAPALGAQYAGSRGVAAVRALDSERAVERHLPGVADVRAVDQALGLSASRLNLNGVAAIRALDEVVAGSASPSIWIDPHSWYRGTSRT